MLKITRVAPDRIDISISGAIDSVEMATGLDRLIAEAETMTKGKMLYRISNIEMPSLGALAVEMGRLPSLFGLLPKIDRCAVLCDHAWLRSMAEFEGAILPGLEIKGFALDAETEAEDWLDGPKDGFDSVPV